jgi:hypothetical protein
LAGALSLAELEAPDEQLKLLPKLVQGLGLEQ